MQAATKNQKKKLAKVQLIIIYFKTTNMIKISFLPFVILLAVSFSSNAQDTSNTVWDLITNSPEHTLLEDLMTTSNLSKPLTGDGPFTVFAPTDAAIAALPANLLTDLQEDPTGALVDFINYHIIADSLRVTDLPNGQTIQTLSGEGIFVEAATDNIFINNTKLSITDIVATNGVLHSIDAVLNPPQEIKPTGKILDVITVSTGHSLLANLVTSAGLTDDLSLRGPFTIFVPSDAALAMLQEDLLNDPTSALAQTLLYHVVPGIAVEGRLRDGQMLTTLQGQNITITKNADGVFVNDAKITKMDILTDNGVIHFIDAVLTPSLDNGADDSNPTENTTYTCQSVDGMALTTTNTTDSNIYIYTPQPNGAVNNQFRYRIVGTNAWSETDISNTHYRYLSDLQSGTNYEFQVKQQCEDSSYSDYSSSGTFTTTGTPPIIDDTDTGDTDTGDTDTGDTNTNDEGDENCQAINGATLYTTNVGQSAAYIYTPQPLGAINNQFRHRVVGTTDWTNSAIATTYYRYLTDLTANTTYEFQVRQECAAGSWSSFSDAAVFTTTSSFQTGASTTQAITTFRNGVIEKMTTLDLTVAPNPAVHQLLVNTNTPLTATASLTLYNMQGKVMENLPVSVGQQQQSIATSSLHPGIYFIQYTDGLVVKTVKFVKE